MSLDAIALTLPSIFLTTPISASPEPILEEPTIEGKIAQFVLVLCVSLSVATLSRTLAWFRQIPYTLLLVIVGLALAVVDIRLVTLSPDIILLIFLPPLLFEAGWNLEWQKLKDNLIPICLYAVLGVVISVAGIGLGLQYLAGLGLGTALLIGASLSATDPVSVIALFRELGVSKRLTILMEGESLFNDGVAVVAFILLIGVAMGTEELSLPVAVVQFATFVSVGIGIGSLIGFGISYITQRFDLPSVEQSLTLVAAYGAYILSEDLGGSGVIAVVTVGLVLGNFGSRIGMNPRTRLIVSEFWEFTAFLVNSIVFLLIGDQVRFGILTENAPVILVAIATVLLTRFIGIFGLGFVSNLISPSKIDIKTQTVLWWGGLRGSVSVALALSVPDSFAQKELIIATVFGVMLFTLLVQGMTTKPLLQNLELMGMQPMKQQYMEAIARRVALNRVIDRLNIIAERKELEPSFFQYELTLVKGQLDSVQEEIEKLQNQHPQFQELIIESIREELLAIESDTYAEFIRTGKLKDSVSPVLQEALAEAGLQDNERE
ncbi:MAG: sodium:proton antiporter [Leptolyngbyaceae bacterium]|nr:sodium:proton antiporter [Leptolyngbyaceae bacterium]